MRSYRKELWFEMPIRRAFLNITVQIERCLADSNVKEGLILINTKQI